MTADVPDWEYAARLWEQQTFKLGRPKLLPHQQPPPGRDWTLWLLEGGRGSGKTEGCARYYSRWMRDNPNTRGRIIAPTLGDAYEACVGGPSGLLAIDDQVQWHPSFAGGSKVTWPNGSEALVLGTPTPRDVDRLRAGGNRHIDWWEELAANKQLGIPGESGEKGAWDQAQFGLRLGTWPHSIASTTPRPTLAYKAIREVEGVVLRHATMYDNPYTSADWRAKMERKYKGTRLGRQELYGLLLEDIEGALWTLELIEATRLLAPLPTLVMTVTAVDPSGSEEGDETGIVTAGRDANYCAYLLADDSTKGTPEHRYEAACLAAARWGSAVILYEPDYGGDSNLANLRSAWEHLTRRGLVSGPCPRILPTKGHPRGPKITGSKEVRAQPVVALYEQQLAYVKDPEHLAPRVYHQQPFPQLEDEQTTWEPDADWSPNRMDAAVYAVRYLTDGAYGGQAEWGGPAMSGTRIG